ncbi:nitroreductase family protein [Pseudomonas sp. X10]
MNIPHDYYLKFIENEVIYNTLLFHNRGNFVIHKSTQHFSTLHHIPQNELPILTGNELRLNPFPEQLRSRIALSPLAQNHTLKRNDSCEKFKKRTIPFTDVKKILSPLLRKEGSTYRRGYPSGGALYPVEVFCCNLENRITAWPSSNKTLHLLSNSKQLESHSPNINQDKLKNALIPKPSNLGHPALALIYCIYLPKAIFKYRYRGYRLAHMEAGSMYMLTDLRCKELHLDSRLWSGFTDHEVAQGLRLNPSLFLPACVQFIG